MNVIQKIDQGNDQNIDQSDDQTNYLNTNHNECLNMNEIQSFPLGKKSSKIKETIIQLLSNLANPKEIDQYLKRFVDAGQTHFAVIKVGGAVLENDMDNLCSSLAFLERIGLFPIIIHGAGPQLSKNLAKENISCQFIDGQRVTSASVLRVAKKTFVEMNLKLANGLQKMGVKTASITTGLFRAKTSSNTSLGYVGEITNVDLAPIKTAISNGAIPIISSMADTSSGQSLNINADLATNHLALKLKPYKIIFLTGTGGLLDKNNNLISSVNLETDYDELMNQSWLHSGMKLKIEQVADILNKLPETASVSITKPMNLSKELFTHKGSGTLIRKGERILTHANLRLLDTSQLKSLLETSFNKTLDTDYFKTTDIQSIVITESCRAAAIIIKAGAFSYLDKFVVAEDAKGEGLGKTLWQTVINENPNLFWRCKKDNPVNTFYFHQADGCYKANDWNIYWCGIKSFSAIKDCVDYALNKKPTLKEVN